MKKLLTFLFFAFFVCSGLKASNSTKHEYSLNSNVQRESSIGKNHSIVDFEKQLGRKLTLLEKIGLKTQKKRLTRYFNETPNALGGQESDSTNGMAIAGFVCSLVLPPLGIIFSAIALGQIKKSGERGKGLATAGLVIGIFFTLLIILL